MRKSIILGFALVLVLSFSLMIGMPVLASPPATAPTATHRCGRRYYYPMGPP